MKWKNKIDEWKTGILQTYPPDIKKRFFYQTSVIDSNLSNEYKEKYIESDRLEKITQDYDPFAEHFVSPKNKYVTSFTNLSGTSVLIVPVPIKSKNYTTIKDFIDNAPKKQQKAFWNHVAECVEELLKIVDKVYLNTHGLGVYYLHVRLDTKPKHYYSSISSGLGKRPLVCKNVVFKFSSSFSFSKRFFSI
jgi:hypothetical protein